jgi:anti-sigma regulatory factor (Ser/Thr protein kinase)
MTPSEPARGRSLQMELPAAHSAEREGRARVREFAAAHGLSREELDALEFVTGELLTNAVDHGGGGRAMHERDLSSPVRMRLAFTVADDSWTLRVSDEGGGDVEELRARIQSDEPPDLEDDRGRGFWMLAQMVQRLDVGKSADGRGLEFVAVCARRRPG